VVLAYDPLAHVISTDERTMAMRLIAEHLTPEGRLLIEGLYRPRRKPLLVPMRERRRAGETTFTVEEMWRPAAEGSIWNATYRYRQGLPTVEANPSSDRSRATKSIVFQIMASR
jgi:hypothetical protein